MGGRGARIGIPSGWKQLEITYQSKNGIVITEQSRIDQANKSKNEMEKYNKESDMCKDLADYGHNIIHLDDRKLSDGSYDILFDGVKADLKDVSSANHIVKYGKKAIREQGAEKVIFRINKYNSQYAEEFRTLQTKGIHGYYFVKGENGLKEF